VANFSKAVVLDIYSDFINNFSQSLEVAKQESKRKSALADFLKVLFPVLVFFLLQ
jgi:Rho guanine nucleotide exchange factor 10